MKKYMFKEKSILTYFLVWLFFGFLICCVGITNVFAASYNVDNFTAQLYDNLGPTLNEVSTTKDIDFYYGFIGLTAYSSGGAWGISSPIPLIANHTYSMTVDPFAVGCGFTILSSYPRLGIGTNLANAKTSYQNNTNVEEKFYQAVSNSKYLQYVFTPSINASYIVFPFATTSSCTSNQVQLSTIVIEDLGESGLSQDQINTSLTNQTNTLNNSINNSTNIITGEINDMQSSLNEQLGDKCNNLFENELQNSITHRGVTFTPVFKNGLLDYYNVSGVTTSYNSYAVIGYYDIPAGVTITVPKINGLFLQLYDPSSGQVIEQFNGSKTINSSYSNIEFNIFVDTDFNGSTSKFWVQVNEGSGTSYCPYGSYNSKLDQTNDKLNDLNSSLNNSNSSGATNDASNFFSNFTTDTFGLTSIITAPLSLINTITSSSCSTLRLPLPYLDNEFLELPCMDSIYSRYFGSFFNLYQTITFGIVSYWVIVRIFNQIKDFKNPEHDEIEVLDL